MAAEMTDDFLEPREGDGFHFEFRRILYRAIKFWYVILIFLLLGIGWAYLQNRYTTRIYPVTASIIIKETQEGSEGKLIYNNPLVSYYRNYLNELYIIRSYPLVQSVLEELNFGVSFYQEGNFMTTEAYAMIPVDAHVVSDNGLSSRRLNFSLVDDDNYQLEIPGDDAPGKAATFAFGDTIQFGGLKLVFTKKQAGNLEKYKNVPFIFQYTRPARLTSSFVARLSASWAEEGSGVILLSINGPTPAKEIDFIDGVIRRYQEYDLDKKNLTATRAIQFIDDQLNGISDSLQKVELQIERFKDKNVMTNLSTEAQRLFIQIQNLESQKTDVLVRKNYYDYLTGYLQQPDHSELAILPTSVGIDDPILTGLRFPS